MPQSREGYRTYGRSPAAESAQAYGLNSNSAAQEEAKRPGSRASQSNPARGHYTF